MTPDQNSPVAQKKKKKKEVNEPLAKSDKSAQGSGDEESLPGKVVLPKEAGRELSIAIDPDVLAAAFGVSDPGVGERLVSQLINVLHPDPNKPVDDATIDSAIALIKGFKPTDTVEATTATMMIAAQHAALDMMRRALHPEQTPAGRALYTGLSLKAMRTFAQLLEVLNHGRGKGVTQRVIVERVINVGQGGRALVGAFHAHPGGQNESEYQSQEPGPSEALPTVKKGMKHP